MKIAIFHNYMDNIGGAEYVDLIMARELGADIYTTNIDKKKIEKMGFKTDNIFSIGKVPENAPQKQELTYWRFRNLNLGRKYGFYIIAGDWAMAAGINNKPNFWYVYSPTREIWDLYKYTRKENVAKWKRPIFDAWVFIRRIINKNDSQKIKNIACISENVRGRIKKYLGRDSTVIYPPIETKKYYYKNPSTVSGGSFWLSVNRLITHKRVEMQIRAFSEIPDEKLVIVGSYEKARHFKAYAEHCKKIKPDNVEIKSWVPEKELVDLYANCKGFITTSKDEDFGMAPVEAMASGKPVIAPDEGGYKETIINGKTGILIGDINKDKLVKAVKNLGREIENYPVKYRDACMAQAKKFDTKIFIKKIKEQMHAV